MCAHFSVKVQKQEYIPASEFDDIYELAAKTRAKIGAFIKYLKSA